MIPFASCLSIDLQKGVRNCPVGLVNSESAFLLSRQYHANFNIAWYPAGMRPLRCDRVLPSSLHKSNYNTRQTGNIFPRDLAKLNLSVLNHPWKAWSGFDNKIVYKCPMVIEYTLWKCIPLLLLLVIFFLSLVRGITRSSVVTDAKYFLLCCSAIGFHRCVCHNGHVLKRTEWLLTVSGE